MLNIKTFDVSAVTSFYKVTEAHEGKDHSKSQATTAWCAVATLPGFHTDIED